MAKQAVQSFQYQHQRRRYDIVSPAACVKDHGRYRALVATGTLLPERGASSPRTSVVLFNLFRPLLDALQRVNVRVDHILRADGLRVVARPPLRRGSRRASRGAVGEAHRD